MFLSLYDIISTTGNAACEMSHELSTARFYSIYHDELLLLGIPPASLILPRARRRLVQSRPLDEHIHACTRREKRKAAHHLLANISSVTALLDQSDNLTWLGGEGLVLISAIVDT